jgi:Family of unknown function (DUF5770)
MDSEDENRSEEEGDDIFEESGDEEKGDEDEFVSEWGALERVSLRNTFKDTFVDPSTDEEFFLSELHKNTGKLYAESEHKVSISNTDIEKIVDLVHKIDHVQYKNALAFLAAYYTLDGRTINKTKLDYISKLLSDEKLNKADIIRYARMINNLV